jgi:UbiD family decarboxylase
MSFHNLHQFLSLLRKEKNLVEITAPVDAELELAEIHRRTIAAGGPALLFSNVKGSSFPVVTNLFGTAQRVLWASGDAQEWVRRLAGWMQREPSFSLSSLWRDRKIFSRIFKMRTKKIGFQSAPVFQWLQSETNLLELPFTKSWKEDGGSFLTLPLVYTEHPDTHVSNLGIYRMQRFSETETGMHWQIDKGGGFHYHIAEQRKEALPVTVFLGGPPALLLSAVAPLPENVPELLLASLLLGSPLETCEIQKRKIIAECDFALVGEVQPQIRRAEGPFGDHYGYYSLTHDFPVFSCKRIIHRKNAIFPATVVGKPKQEDFFIGDFLQELLSPIFPIVMPGVVDLWSYGETGYHALSAAVVKERYYRECMKSAFRILGEGQLSLTKFLIVLTDPLNLKDFRAVLIHVLERFQPETDLFVFANLSMDTLDYSGPEINKGSKGLMLAMGEKRRQLPEVFSGMLPAELEAVAVFCPGCLVLCPRSKNPLSRESLEALTQHASFKDWPLLVLNDEVKRITASSSQFLWNVFTRLDPARDIHSGKKQIQHNRVVFSGPILFDCRKRPGFPEELFCDLETADLVTKRWKEYFPHDNVEMGIPF